MWSFGERKSGVIFSTSVSASSPFYVTVLEVVYACSSIEKEDSASTQYDREVVGYNDLPKYAWNDEFSLEEFKTEYLDNRNHSESDILKDVIRSEFAIGYSEQDWITFEGLRLTDGKLLSSYS